MKYPALLPCSEALARLDEFDAIIDVRSEAEFAEDHLPGAINCPVLSDAERIRIGTMYKQVNAFEAKKAGAVLVARNIARHVETLWLDKPRTWLPLIYCWRGGNRSGAMAHVLAKIGWPSCQLDGGYKEFRRQVMADLQDGIPGLRFRVVCGPTGSGKSRLLQVLARQGAQVLDLEALAKHRGSVLGNLPSQPQPSQKFFESQIWNCLRAIKPEQVVFVESESKKIGNLRVPEALMASMRAAPCIALELPHAWRIALLMEDYAHFVADPSALNAQLDCLTCLHGRGNIERWQALAMTGAIRELVDELLTMHYDPAYLRSIKRNFTLFPQAQSAFLADISDAEFLRVAQGLLVP